METLIAVALLLGVGYLMFASGKRTGSRGGFNARRRCRCHRYR